MNIPGFGIRSLLVCLLTCAILLSCSQDKYPDSFFEKYISKEFPYNLGTPSEKFEFPWELQEISALEYYKNGIIAGVQDEEGILYLYDVKNHTLARKIRFTKHGDFEGVALAGDHAFIMSSKGELYSFPITDKDKVKPDLLNTPFHSNNNLEGLCYYPGDSSLLIVCKNDPGIKKKIKGRAVYRFDLASHRVEEKPFIHLKNELYKKKLDSLHLDIRYHSPFRPSGISVNPENGDIYLISSTGKLLIVFNKSLEIVTMVPLNRSLFEQPEGICFSPEGDLFISSEGRRKKGYMLRFARIK